MGCPALSRFSFLFCAFVRASLDNAPGNEKCTAFGLGASVLLLAESWRQLSNLFADDLSKLVQFT